MKIQTSIALILGCVSCAHAASTQIGDLRLPSGNYPGAFTYFDAASGGDLTRAVTGAPVGINSNFVAVTQNPDGGTPSNTDDIGVRTYSTATTLRTLNRFDADDGNPTRAGAVQWTIDLAPIGGYLSANSLALSALDLRLVTDPSDDAKNYDVYLSYTNPGESITLASLSTSATAGDDNYSNFWLPAQTVSEGSVASGTHKVIELDFTGNMDTTIDLLALYNAGVEDINLIMASGAFFSGRTIGIIEGSGLTMDTVPVPEPATSFLALFATLGLLRRRR